MLKSTVFSYCVALLMILSLSACSTTRYVAVAPELETAFRWLSYDEIVLLMEREPDEIIDMGQDGRKMVYRSIIDNAYLKNIFEHKQFRMPSKLFVNILLNEDDVCYTIETNAERRIEEFDRNKTEEAIGKAVGTAIYIIGR